MRYEEGEDKAGPVICTWTQVSLSAVPRSLDSVPWIVKHQWRIYSAFLVLEHPKNEENQGKKTISKWQWYLYRIS